MLRPHQLSDFGAFKQNPSSHAALVAYAEGGSAYTLDHIIGDSPGTPSVSVNSGVLLRAGLLITPL